MLRDPMDRSTPGLPAHHQLPELAQTPVRVAEPEVAAVRSGKPGSAPTFPTLASRLSAMPTFLSFATFRYYGCENKAKRIQQKLTGDSVSKQLEIT